MHVRVANDPRASPPVDSGTLSSIGMLLACSLACKYWDSPIRGISPDNLAHPFASSSCELRSLGSLCAFLFDFDKCARNSCSSGAVPPGVFHILWLTGTL